VTSEPEALPVFDESATLKVGPVRDRRPLSVQVYDQLVEALSSHGQPGDLIPPEVELAAMLGVSRTVLREALRLLEEDGVIQRSADPRRRQLAPAGTRPVAFSAPLEEMLQSPGRVVVEVNRTERVRPTRWSTGLLGLADDAASLVCRESVVRLDGEPVASALELVPTDDPAFSGHVLTIEARADQDRTLLMSLGSQFRAKAAPALWRLGPGSSAGSRKGFTQSPAGALTALTTVLARQGRPVFLAKYLIRLDSVMLTLGAEGLEAD
jgi:GntR family transcriptional regulator